MPERKSFLLRLSPDLWEELQRLAAEDLRSVNAEIEFLLREAVRKRGGLRRPKSRDDEDET
ncbi:MAG: Arc family DNA-binding protein [Fimbriimonadaceae bacterium]